MYKTQTYPKKYPISGIVYSACVPIHENGNSFAGVTCIDILMRDMVQELTASHNMDMTYTFMLDPLGTIDKMGFNKDSEHWISANLA